MAHKLTVNNGKAEMFSGQNIVPWHGLGTIVEGLLTSREAIKAASLDWEVEKRPVTTDYIKDGIKEPQDVEGFHAVCRKDNQLALSVVKSRYELIQNSEAFDFFDEVVGKGQAFYDTAGSLDDGRIVWIMAKLPGTLFIKNDPSDITEKNVLLVTSHDGSKALSAQIVATRVVCANTLSIALKGAKNQIKIRHTKSYKDKLEEAQKTLELANGYFDSLQELMDKLSNVDMSKDQMKEFTRQLIPAEESDVPTRTLNTREAIETLFVNGRGNKGKTRWDGLNAVTEYVDHSRTTRNGTTRFEAGLLGSGVALKQKAFDLLAN